MALQTTSLPSSATDTLASWLEGLLNQAHLTTVRTPLPQMAAELQGLFGQRIIAFMTGVADPKAVGRWARAERTPRGDAEQRLRDAYQIATFLTLADSAETARAWFIGMNPHFGDRAPFAILGENPSKSHEVLEAAKAFVVNG
jgi:hypothetical protein